jgi:hypothetical protein
MFLGHYGLALAARRLAPKPSLGTTLLAANLADEVWPLLLLLGIEQVKIVPGLMAVSDLDFTSYPWTHSLLVEVLAGLVLGGCYLLARRDRLGALVVAALVPSHWVLDVFFHRPDLPLWPGGPRYGLGLWNSLPLTLIGEAVIFGGGLWIYLRRTKAIDRTGRWALWGLVAVLVASYLSSLFSPPPLSTTALAWMALVPLWLFIPWGYWIGRHRESRVEIA